VCGARLQHQSCLGRHTFGLTPDCGIHHQPFGNQQVKAVIVARHVQALYAVC